MTGSGADAENAAAPFPCNCSARCFRAECAKIPRAASAKLHKMQFLCIAKRVTVNNVNSDTVQVYPRDAVSKQAYISRKRDNASMN